MAKALAKAVQNASIAVGPDDKVEALGAGTGTAHFEEFERAVRARAEGDPRADAHHRRRRLEREERLVRAGQDPQRGARGPPQRGPAAHHPHDPAPGQRALDAQRLQGPAPTFKFEDDTGLQLERASAMRRARARRTAPWTAS
jgi:hypothetical protein